MADIAYFLVFVAFGLLSWLLVAVCIHLSGEIHEPG